MKREVESDWNAVDVPSGFRVISTQQKLLPDAEDPLTHIVYGDGLVTVSVFIGPDCRRADNNKGCCRKKSRQSSKFKHSVFRVLPGISERSSAHTYQQ